MKPSISIAILAFGAPRRLEKMLESLRWAGWPRVVTRVFEDTVPDVAAASEISAQYADICNRYGVEYRRSKNWNCVQGSAQLAVVNSPEDWIIILSDDVLFSKGCMQHSVDTIERYHDSCAGLFNIPYWESHDLIDSGIIASADEPWANPPEYMLRIPESKYWNEPWNRPGMDDRPKIYINVHGTGFLLRRRVWELQGGFRGHTWRWDEGIAFGCWMYTPYAIFTQGGPALVHMMGGAVKTGKTQFSYDPSSFDAWERAWSVDKKEVHRLLYMAMVEAGGEGAPIEKCRMREAGILHKKENMLTVV